MHQLVWKNDFCNINNRLEEVPKQSRHSHAALYICLCFCHVPPKTKVGPEAPKLKSFKLVISRFELSCLMIFAHRNKCICTSGVICLILRPHLIFFWVFWQESSGVFLVCLIKRITSEQEAGDLLPSFGSASTTLNYYILVQAPSCLEAIDRAEGARRRWGNTQRVETGGSDFWEENNIESIQFY